MLNTNPSHFASLTGAQVLATVDSLLAQYAVEDAARKALVAQHAAEAALQAALVAASAARLAPRFCR